MFRAHSNKKLVAGVTAKFFFFRNMEDKPLQFLSRKNFQLLCYFAMAAWLSFGHLQSKNGVYVKF